MLLGAHISIAGGPHKAIERGLEIGCETIQIFVKSNRRWDAKPMDISKIEKFKEIRNQFKIEPIFSHNTYLVNLASPDNNTYKKSVDCFLYEIITSEQLGLEYIVMHPGSHLGSGEETGLKKIAESVRKLLLETEGSKIRILLETMAGQGSNLGYKFEQLKFMMDIIDYPDRIGVCFDTCHAFAAGYDIRTEKAYNETLDEFNSVIGLENLYVIHLNDSAGDLGSRIDRHQHIGQGKIGLEGFRHFLNDKRFEKIPGAMETTKDKEGIIDRKNLEVLRSLIDK